MTPLNIFLIVFGLALIVHHGLTYSWLDPTDLIGHDWLGLVLVMFAIANEKIKVTEKWI